MPPISPKVSIRLDFFSIKDLFFFLNLEFGVNGTNTGLFAFLLLLVILNCAAELLSVTYFPKLNAFCLGKEGLIVLNFPFCFTLTTYPFLPFLPDSNLGNLKPGTNKVGMFVEELRLGNLFTKVVLRVFCKFNDVDKLFFKDKAVLVTFVVTFLFRFTFLVGKFKSISKLVLVGNPKEFLFKFVFKLGKVTSFLNRFPDEGSSGVNVVLGFPNSGRLKLVKKLE